MKEITELENLKLINDNEEIQLGIEIPIKLDKCDKGIQEIDDLLIISQNRLKELNKDIDKFTSSADGLDCIVAICSGIIAGIVDSLWVGAFDFQSGKQWSNEKVNNFVMEMAKKQGYEGERLDDAIKFLEKKFPVPADNIWSGKGIGISARSHHLDDLAHHPTPLGLFFSILTQFTKNGYFSNKEGEFFPISIDEKNYELIGNDIPSKIFSGTINWFFHLVSDMSGSNKTAGAGMGIPGPIVSMLKEISGLPGIKDTKLSKEMHTVFVKEKFDLRSELAVAHELGKQAIPVLLNEIIVRAFYFIRRLAIEIKEKKNFKDIEWKKTIPFGNRTIVRMVTISSSTFMLIDLADAAIRGAIEYGKSGGNPAMFAKEFILRVNFVGVGRCALAVGTDIAMGYKRDKKINERILLMNEQIHLNNGKLFYMQANMWKSAEKTEEAIMETLEIMEQAINLSLEAWEENKKSLNKIGEYREGIEKNNSELKNEILDILKWG